MPDKCKIHKAALNIQEEINQNKINEFNELVEHYSKEDEIETEIVDNITKELDKDNNADNGTVIESDVIREKYKKIYGTVDERQLLALEIKAMLKQNPVALMILKDILMPHKAVGKYERLRDYPIGLLKVAYVQLMKFNDKNDTFGLFGANNGILVRMKNKYKKSILSPQGVGKLENTGAIYKFAHAMQSYYDRISNRVNLFAKGRRSKGTTKIQKGIQDVYNKLEKLLEYLPDDGTPYHAGYRHPDKALDELFAQIMMGWVKMEMIDVTDKNGKVIGQKYGFRIAKTHDAKLDHRGNKVFYPNGDGVYEYSDFVDIDTYLLDKDKDSNTYGVGKYSMPGYNSLSKNKQKLFWNKLKKITEQAREIDDAAFKYMQEEFDKSILYILQAMGKLFPGLTAIDIRALFFEKSENFESKKHKQVKASLDDKQLALFNKLHSTFDGFASMSFFQFGTADSKYKKNHWPIIFNRDKFRFVYDDFIRDLENKLLGEYDPKLKERSGGLKKLKKDIQQAIKDGWAGIDKFHYWYKGEKVYGAEAISLITKEIRVIESSLRRAYKLRNNADNMGYDHESSELIPAGTDQKYLKRITNAFDPRHARTSRGVYGDYLRSAMASIERNVLSAELMEAIEMLQQEDGSINEEVLDYLINYYKVPFNRTDTKGSFGPMTYSADSISNMVSKGSFGRVNISADTLQDKFKKISSYVTGRYLKGHFTTLQNATAIMNQLHFEGWKSMVRLLKDYVKIRNKPDNPMMDLISRSGVIDFSDFFSESMIGDIADAELESATYTTIVGAMMLYYKQTDKNPGGKEQYYEDMLRTIDAALKDSRAFNMSTESIVMLSEGRAKQRYKEIKKGRRRQVLQQYANYAITKQFEVSRHIRKIPIEVGGKKIWNKASAVTTAQNIYKIWTDTYSSFFGTFTMSTTEQMVRSMAFMAGIQHLQSVDKKYQIPLEDYTPDMEAMAISYGRFFNRMYQFGLSTTDVGQFNWSAFGNLMGKFSYYTQQKFGNDARLVHQAIDSMKDFERLLKEQDGTLGFASKKTDDTKAFLKLMWQIITPNTNLRETNPSAANFRSFITQNMLTWVIMDLIIMGPWKVGSSAYRIFGPGATRNVKPFTSDYLTLLLSPLTLFLYALGGGYEDPEDVEKQVSYFSRKTMLGWGPNMGIDFIAGLALTVAGEREAAAQKFENMGRVIVPFKGIEVGIDVIKEIFRD